MLYPFDIIRAAPDTFFLRVDVHSAGGLRPVPANPRFPHDHQLALTLPGPFGIHERNFMTDGSRPETMRRASFFTKDFWAPEGSQD